MKSDFSLGRQFERKELLDLLEVLILIEDFTQLIESLEILMQQLDEEL